MMSEDTNPLFGPDPHRDLDYENLLSKVTVVIPSNRERNHTAKSVPDWIDTIVRTDEGRSIARNRGIEEADTDWIIIADDDITFPTTLTGILLDAMHEQHLVGLEDAWPMEWALTRYMVFHRDLWNQVGGFDESREHGEDTDFCIRAEKAGATICTLPRRIVPHHDSESSFEQSEHIEWLWYLLQRHPRHIFPKAVMLALAKMNFVSPKNDYGPEWEGKVWDTRELPEASEL